MLGPKFYYFTAAAILVVSFFLIDTWLEKNHCKREVLFVEKQHSECYVITGMEHIILVFRAAFFITAGVSSLLVALGCVASPVILIVWEILE